MENQTIIILNDVVVELYVLESEYGLPADARDILEAQRQTLNALIRNLTQQDAEELRRDEESEHREDEYFDEDGNNDNS